MNKIICEDWTLYSDSYKGVIRTEVYTGEKFSDIIPEAKELRVYGTKKQLRDLEDKYSIDEIYSFQVEKKGSYWYDVFGSKAESINEATEKKLKELDILYKLNDNKVLILRTK